MFQYQLLDHLKAPKILLQNLFLFPTTATAFYRYKGGWKKVYNLELSKKDRDLIKATFQKVFDEIGYKHPKKTYGKLIEDRRTEVVFSVYGQDLVSKLGKKGILMKERWTREHTLLKLKIAKRVQKHLPHLHVSAAGFTSIDVTKKGVDKAFGLRKIEKYLKVKVKDTVFIGDAIFPGGNDYAVVKTGVDYIAVKNPIGTNAAIQGILKK